MTALELDLGKFSRFDEMVQGISTLRRLRSMYFRATRGDIQKIQCITANREIVDRITSLGLKMRTKSKESEIFDLLTRFQNVEFLEMDLDFVHGVSDDELVFKKLKGLKLHHCSERAQEFLMRYLIRSHPDLELLSLSGDYVATDFSYFTYSVRKSHFQKLKQLEMVSNQDEYFYLTDSLANILGAAVNLEKIWIKLQSHHVGFEVGLEDDDQHLDSVLESVFTKCKSLNYLDLESVSFVESGHDQLGSCDVCESEGVEMDSDTFHLSALQAIYRGLVATKRVKRDTLKIKISVGFDTEIKAKETMTVINDCITVLMESAVDHFMVIMGVILQFDEHLHGRPIKKDDVMFDRDAHLRFKRYLEGMRQSDVRIESTKDESGWNCIVITNKGCTIGDYDEMWTMPF